MAAPLPALWPTDLNRDKFMLLKTPHSVDDLFVLLFSKPEYHAKFLEICEIAKYVGTNWVKTKEELPASLTYEDVIDNSNPNPPGPEFRYRKFRLEQGGKRIDVTDRYELWQLTEYYPGQRYIVESLVNITGKEDTLHMFRHYLLLPDGADKSKLLVTFGIVPDPHRNFIFRHMIYRTAKGNVIKNLGYWRKCVDAFGETEEISEHDVKQYMEINQKLPPIAIEEAPAAVESSANEEAPAAVEPSANEEAPAAVEPSPNEEAPAAVEPNAIEEAPASVEPPSEELAEMAISGEEAEKKVE